MTGTLLLTAEASMLGGPTASQLPLRNAGQWIIGCALGLYFTPQVVALLAGLWWAIALNIVRALALGLVFGEWLYWLHHRTGLVGVGRHQGGARNFMGWTCRAPSPTLPRP